MKSIKFHSINEFPSNLKWVIYEHRVYKEFSEEKFFKECEYDFITVHYDEHNVNVYLSEEKMSWLLNHAETLKTIKESESQLTMMSTCVILPDGIIIKNRYGYNDSMMTVVKNKPHKENESENTLTNEDMRKSISIAMNTPLIDFIEYIYY